jgi:inosine-uridine nucleoside N-ribohydrolase
MCASGVHGVTGLRGYSFAKDYTKNLVSEPAWELLRDVLMGSDEQVTLIAIGPVTNIALLLRFHPEVKPKIKEIVFMGTSYHCGNPTPLATFNVLVDPEAFRQVLFSGIPFVACPLDVTRTAIIGADECKMIRRLDSRVSQFVMSIIDNYGLSALKPEELENLDVTHE